MNEYNAKMNFWKCNFDTLILFIFSLFSFLFIDKKISNVVQKFKSLFDTSYINLLLNIIVYGQNFILEPLYLHTAELIGDKIYCIGGDNPNKASTEQNPESDIIYVKFYDKIFFSWVKVQNQGVKFPHTVAHTYILPVLKE